jgi:hypothetical protein
VHKKSFGVWSPPHAKNGEAPVCDSFTGTAVLQRLYSASVQVPILSRVMGRKEGRIDSFQFHFLSCGLKNVVTLLSLILAPLTWLTSAFFLRVQMLCWGFLLFEWYLTTFPIRFISVRRGASVLWLFEFNACSSGYFQLLLTLNLNNHYPFMYMS